LIETIAFDDFAAKKSREAVSASIERLSTVFDRRDSSRVRGIGNTWSREHYGGEFGLVHPQPTRTAISLVLIQTKDRNTGGPNPGAFGGGATDKHLIYEGLSRVAVNAVLAGAGSVHQDAFFSVWHPELIALRSSLGLPRHPGQIVVSKRGSLNFNARLFNVPDVQVFLIAGDECAARHEPALRARPWVRLILSSGDLSHAFERLRREEGEQWSHGTSDLTALLVDVHEHRHAGPLDHGAHPLPLMVNAANVVAVCRPDRHIRCVLSFWLCEACQLSVSDRHRPFP
jgi:hypothetical protein